MISQPFWHYYLTKEKIKTAKKLKLEGYDVIPHLPARTVLNNKDLERYIGCLLYTSDAADE